MINIVAIVITFREGMSNTTLSLTLFATSPYFVLLYLVSIARHRTSVVTALSLTFFLVSVGLYFLLDTTYMERRLEDKFSFLFIPIWQLTMLLFGGFVVYLSNKKE
jgi:hypothetical protein